MREVYNCYKGVKKTFRKYCRYYLQHESDMFYQRLNNMYRDRRMTCFWNGIKQLKRKRVNSSLDAQTLGDFYCSIMNDNHTSMTENQQLITDTVRHKFTEATESDDIFKDSTLVTADMVSDMISKLNKNSSPGCDGITAEHLIHGRSTMLCNLLASFYTFILSHCIVPCVFNTGIIIPILKKSCLNPNTPENFRPITLSSVHAKLIELFMVPADKISDIQFGFREKRSAPLGCTFLNDISLYFNNRGSPLYVCTLDAEKCFDRVWHDGLMYKLLDVLPLSQWSFLCKWYGGLTSLVRWNGDYSLSFPVTRGVRQGSILSPHLFNIFINDMLESVEGGNNGAYVGADSFSAIAYADDVTLLSSTITGLQSSINICVKYASDWRFNFNANKSKCIVMGPNVFNCNPTWTLGNVKLETVDNVGILGVQFSTDNSASLHVDNRIKMCRQNYFGLANVGLSYPGLSTAVKTHLWKTICSPILTYGLDTQGVSKACLTKLESTQGTLVKRYLGIGKRSHHSSLLKSLHIPKVQTVMQDKTLSLFQRIFQVQSPLLNLYSFMLAHYILNGKVFKGTLVDRVVQLGFSPLQVAFAGRHFKTSVTSKEDGVVDTLRYLTYHENFIKPWSNEHVLTVLLTRCY